MTSQTTHPTATELLHRQHEQVKEMFDDFAKATGAKRSELFDCLRATLATHETAEEMIVHPLARHVSGDDGARVVDARLVEEDAAKQLLAELERLGPDHAEFDAKFEKFHRAVLAHAEAEEHELFPILDDKVDRDRLEETAKLIEFAEKLAPTHPHPHGPKTAVGNLVVGPFVAMVDRVRDEIQKATKNH